MLTDVVFNGKFLSAAPTGVHRVALELIRETDTLLAEEPKLRAGRSWKILQPKDANRPIALQRIVRRTCGRLTWQPWEQFDLPRFAGSGLLVNLCNLAPLFRPGGITMIHDAQVFISPESYSRAFGGFYRFALPRIGRSAARILTVSSFSARQLAAHGVALESKIEVIHNGADHILAAVSDEQILARLGLTEGRYAVALANTQAHKNIRILLRAFGLAHMRHLQLVLVGPHSAEAFAAAGMPTSDNVIFAGPVNDGALRALMEHAACLAFPSTTEGFGLPPLEAMTVGCPTVVAPCGALPESCGDAARYVDPNDAEAWADAIATFAEDSRVHAQAIADGRRHAAGFTWRRSARRMLAVIGQVTAER